MVLRFKDIPVPVVLKCCLQLLIFKKKMDEIVDISLKGSVTFEGKSQ